MNIIDISPCVQDSLLYPGSDRPLISKTSDMDKGAGYNECRLEVTSHLGTHADAFKHFINDGLTIDQMKLEHYYGSCHVVSVPPNKLIEASDLEGKLSGVERLVIHGGGEAYLSEEAARLIADSNIITVITDAWSVAPLHNEGAIHLTLMNSGIAVIENVRLDNVSDGEYIISALPIKYAGLDGAPVRAVLIQN